MKKILSMLGITFLSIITSISIVACDKGEKPISPAIKIDISTKIPSIINLDQFVTKNVVVFKIELQKQLRKLNDLKTIQFDFLLPRKFNLTYIDQNNKKKLTQLLFTVV